MKSYVVGGAVRDALLGLPGADRDWVVVGATPEQMSALGYTPVGRDFPVFLHPVTHEEYALARTERKSGRGYRGFTVFAAPEVTLEEDLRRRDLTINAIARAEDGSLIDPFGGQQDLRAGLLRHVSPAFAEDPVRILRVARFAARFRFTVAEDTLALMQSMVAAGEADFLVPERVWQEFARGLCERHPEEMFRVLEHCGALPRLAPELHAILAGEARGAALEALERAAAAGAPLARRFAVLAWFVRPDAANACAQELAALCEKLRAPLEVRDLAVLACRCRAGLRQAAHATPAALLDLLRQCDAFRRRERLDDFLAAATLAEPALQAGAGRLRAALAAAAAVDAGAIARAAARPADIPAALDAARSEAIARAVA